MAGRRKENDREELKLRVVETASKSFMTLGIKAVHMDDIASSLSICLLYTSDAADEL